MVGWFLVLFHDLLGRFDGLGKEMGSNFLVLDLVALGLASGWVPEHHVTPMMMYLAPLGLENR